LGMPAFITERAGGAFIATVIWNPDILYIPSTNWYVLYIYLYILCYRIVPLYTSMSEYVPGTHFLPQVCTSTYCMAWETPFPRNRMSASIEKFIKASCLSARTYFLPNVCTRYILFASYTGMYQYIPSTYQHIIRFLNLVPQFSPIRIHKGWCYSVHTRTVVVVRLSTHFVFLILLCACQALPAWQQAVHENQHSFN
jgi:hypothetical protein